MSIMQKINQQGQITLPEDFCKSCGEETFLKISQLSEETVLIRKVEKFPTLPSDTEDSLLAHCAGAAVLCDKCTGILQLLIDDLLARREASVEQAKKEG